MAKLPSLLEMLQAGVHFGHQTSRWHPKMEKFIFGTRNSVHIIDLESTLKEMGKVLHYIKTLASQGKVILFVGTKHQARVLVKEAAEKCGMPYIVERWIGGLLTNFVEVKRRLKMYRELKEQFTSCEIEKYSKKEQVMLKKKLEKMDKYLIGLTDLKELPDALYLVDARVEKTALTEARRVGVSVTAVMDTNVNPEKIDHGIPANDDAVNSIKMMVDLIAEAVNEGKVEWDKKQVEIEIKVKKDSGKEIVEKKRRALKKEVSV